MSEYGDRRAMASAERAWLEPPSGEFPRGVEDWLDTVIFFPDTFEPGTTIEELVAEYDGGDNPTDEELFGIVIGYEASEDEEGDHIGLEVQGLSDKTRSCWVSLDHADEYKVPEGPLRDMASSAERVYKAREALREREREYRGCWPTIRYRLVHGELGS